MGYRRDGVVMRAQACEFVDVTAANFLTRTLETSVGVGGSRRSDKR